MTIQTTRALVRSRVNAALLVTALAIGLVAPHVLAQDVKMDGYPAIGAPPIVTLVSPGAEPRVKMRYAIAPTYKGIMVSSASTTMTMDIAGNSMPAMTPPTMKSTADLTVTGIAANGDLSYTVAMTGMTPEAAGADPAVMQAMAGFDADIKTVNGKATISNRGEKRSSTFDISKVTNPALKQALDAMLASLDNLCAALPEDAIGVGGKWETRAGAAAGGMSTFVKTTYEVVSIDAKSVTLKVTGDQSAPPQSVSNPNLPPGAESRLQKMSGKTTGTMTIKFDELVPTSSLSSQVDMVMEISMGGQSTVMGVSTASKAEVAPKKAGG